MGLILIIISGYIVAMIILLWQFKFWGLSKWTSASVSKKLKFSSLFLIITLIFTLSLIHKILIFNIDNDYKDFKNTKDFCKIKITVINNPAEILLINERTITEKARIAKYQIILSKKKVFFQNHPKIHWKVKILFYDHLSNVDKFKITKFDDDGIECLYYGNNTSSDSKRSIYFTVANELGEMIVEDINKDIKVR